jgi:DnaJ-class molecular chaperone
MPRRRDADREDAMPACPACGGSGHIYDANGIESDCPVCKGKGRVTRAQWSRYITKHAATQPSPGPAAAPTSP